MLGLAPTAFHEDVAGQAGAGHAEGVADGDGAAIDVVLRGVDAELVAAVETLAGEGFVQFPEVDVADLKAVALQQTRDREDRADAHFIRLAAGDGPTLEGAQGLQAAALGFLCFHHHDGGGAVGELAGIACRDELAGALYRLKLGEAFERRVGAIALVAVDDVVDDALGLRGLVDDLHLRVHRDDLVLELAGLLGGGHAAL